MRRRPARLALLAIALTATSMSGCATLRQLFSSAFKKPTFTFKSAQVADPSLSGVTLNLIYEVNNPNSLGLSLAEVDYALFIDGKQLVAGKPRAGLSIPARRRTQVVFPASVKFAELAPAVATFLTKDQAQYRATGNVGIKTPIGILRFPLSKEGTFEVPKVPNIQLGSPRISSLSLSGLTLELPLSVTNRNSFALPIAQVSGGLQVSGVNVGSLSTGNLGELTAGQTRQVVLPLTLNLASAPAAFTAIKSGRARFALNGQVQSGGAGVPFNVSDLLNVRR